MKILMIGWGFPPRIQGGLDVHVYEICRELAKTNEVMLTLPAFNSPTSVPSKIKIIPIKCRLRNDLAKTVSEYNCKITKVCRGLDFDIVHSHDWFGTEASERLSKVSRSPWILTLHSLEYMRSCEFGAKSIMERLERKAARGCDKLITVSMFMKNSIMENYGVEPEKIEVVYNSARTHHGNPAKIRKRLGLGRKHVVLFIGRLSQQKGVEYLINSADAVLEKVPDARFVIAGEGNMRGSLEKFSRHMGLDGKVIFPGFVPEKELASYYSAADVFVYPSVYEPFGISVLEALLSGTPAITSEQTGVMEMLPEMASLRAVKPWNSEELAENIVRILRQRRRVSEREREILARTYSWEKSAGEIMCIYQKVS